MMRHAAAAAICHAMLSFFTPPAPYATRRHAATPLMPLLFFDAVITPIFRFMFSQLAIVFAFRHFFACIFARHFYIYAGACHFR